jgi:predicted nucleotidyltransferase
MVRDKELHEILKKLASSLLAVYGEKLNAVILYGSVARGTDNSESDIDIMVLVDTSEEELKKYRDALCDVSVDFDLEYLKVFSIVDICNARFNAWKDVLPFYQNVAKEGIVIYAA